MRASVATNLAMKSPITTCYGPILDGKYFTRQHTESLAKGLFRKIPLMINTVRDEGEFFVSSTVETDILSPREFQRRLLPYYTEQELDTLDKLYPVTRDAGTPHPRVAYANLSDIFTEYYFQCPSRKLAQAYASRGLQVFKSYLTHSLGIFSNVPAFSRAGPAHGEYLVHLL
jgi:carboxylesterase type B